MAFCVSHILSPTRDRARELEEDDKCSVCLDPPTEPRLLPCCHVFCTKCLQGMLDDVRARPMSSLSLGGLEGLLCPNCRSESDPLASAEEYPLRQTLQRVEECPSPLETGINAAKELEACKCCEDEGTADEEPSAYCEDCGGGICQDCDKLHHKLKHFKEHNRIDWVDYSAANSSFTVKKQRKKCAAHDMEIQLYCELCSQFLCSLCLKERHNTHMDSSKPLQEVRGKRLAELTQMKGAAEDRLDSCEQHLEGIREMERGLTDYPDSLEKSITTAFDEYMQQLRTWRELKLAEAREMYSDMRKMMSAQKIDTINAIVTLKTGIDVAEKASGCSNINETIEMSGRALQQLKTTLDTARMSPFQRPLVYEKGVLNLGKLRDLREGDINVKPPEYCFMNTENTIVVNFTLPVHTQPLVKVLYGSQKQRSLKLHPNTLSTVDKFNVDFYPRCAGKHSIEVWVGGVMCKRCDDVMVVRGAPAITSTVKPGPDWNGDENIHVTTGTVLNAEPLTELPTRAVSPLDDGDDEVHVFQVEVNWNNGDVIKYQWGNDDKYELELLV